ncbi:hypothetical protein D3C74_416760 [compost metagenome]
MVFRVFSAHGNEIVWISSINLKAFGSAIGTKLDGFPSISIRKLYPVEHVTFYKKGRSLDQGSIFIGHFCVTKQEQLFTIQVHVMGSFSYDISLSLVQNS